MRESKGMPTWVIVVALGVSGLITIGCNAKGTKYPTQPPASNLTVPVTTTLVAADFEVQDGIDNRTKGFEDTSTGGPIRWRWNFGDGATSGKQHPIHKFRKPGIYSVTLTVENRISQDSIMKFVLIDEESEEPAEPAEPAAPEGEGG